MNRADIALICSIALLFSVFTYATVATPRTGRTGVWIVTVFEVYTIGEDSIKILSYGSGSMGFRVTEDYNFEHGKTYKITYIRFATQLPKIIKVVEVEI